MIGSETQRDAAQRRSFLGLLFGASASVLATFAGSDVARSDAGEIGTASFVLGVAHPTGFPLDLLWLRAAACVPLGSIAFRQNVAVALMSALALTLLAHLVLVIGRALSIAPARGGIAGALLAALALLSSRTFLGTAIGVEVYSTALVFVLAGGVALLDPQRRARLFPLLGLACGTHVTAGLLLLPSVLTSVVLRPAARRVRALCVLAVPMLATALVVAYLPLASRRDPPLDWGDPETLSGLWAHLSAARIRSSFAGEMFSGSGSPGLALFRQLTENAWLCWLSLFGTLVLALRARRVALVIYAILALDLGYAVWVNPMGIADRQLGHVACAIIALLAGVGVSAAVERLTRVHSRMRVAAAHFACVGACALLGAAIVWPDPRDGYATSERHGSGSVLSSLPARSAYLCVTDMACAAALFALHVERVRPDVVLAPAQHLWDATVLRMLRPWPLIEAFIPDAPVAATARRAHSARVLAAIALGPLTRPVFFEEWPAIPGLKAELAGLARAAPLAERDAPVDISATENASLQQLDRQLRARFGTRAAPSPLGSELWFEAYQRNGKFAMAAQRPVLAERSFQRALDLDPSRAVGFVNLGVALEAQGKLEAAIDATRRAIALAPERPIAWFNLARLMLRAYGPEAALQVVVSARERGVSDPRLSGLARHLQTPRRAESDPRAPVER